MIKELFGKIIQKERKAQRRTQEDVAGKAEIATRFLQEIESGDKRATIDTLFKLSKSLNVTPDTLIMPLWGEWVKALPNEEG